MVRFPIFQFHKGTIRTKNLPYQHDSNLHFNSIKVRLELFTDGAINAALIHFNSIKVRLEQEITLSVTQSQQFQFHKGTIRTRQPSRPDIRFLRISIP